MPRTQKNVLIYIDVAEKMQYIFAVFVDFSAVPSAGKF